MSFKFSITYKKNLIGGSNRSLKRRRMNEDRFAKNQKDWVEWMFGDGKKDPNNRYTQEYSFRRRFGRRKRKRARDYEEKLKKLLKNIMATTTHFY